jgi:hypothetical protein
VISSDGRGLRRLLGWIGRRLGARGHLFCVRGGRISLRRAFQIPLARPTGADDDHHGQTHCDERAGPHAFDRGRYPTRVDHGVCGSIESASDPEQAMNVGIKERIEALDWDAIARSLDERGYATTRPLLKAAECRGLIAMYPDRAKFRSRVDMARHRFGEGEYKYFADPIPPLVREMRGALYAKLAPIANRWADAMRSEARYPPTLGEFLALCHEQGQRKPTPLILRYETGGYNCMHQDLYGAIAFPLQFTCVLSRRGEDFEGGEFLLLEQRPRAQSRAEAITLDRGEAIIFPNRYRPVRGARGFYRVNVRHGVSRLRAGQRYSLGIIFHDAN